MITRQLIAHINDEALLYHQFYKTEEKSILYLHGMEELFVITVLTLKPDPLFLALP